MTAIADATVRDLRTPDGRTLRSYAAGDPDGELVVVHHGTPASGTLAGWWATDAAARGIRLVGYDRPGYGGSDRKPGRAVGDAAADTALVADAYGFDRFRTWGVSGGGPHALACAALLPDRVIAAASLASVAPYDVDPDLDFLAGMGEDNVTEFGAAVAGEDELRAFMDQALPGLLASTPDTLVTEMGSLLPDVDAAVLTGEMATFMHTWMTAGQQSGYDGWVDDDLAFTHDWGFGVNEITVPVLLLQGRHDLMVPFAHGVWLSEHMPTVDSRLSDDDGHLTLVADLGPVHEWLMSH